MKRNFAFWLHYLMRLRPTNSAFQLFLCFALMFSLATVAQAQEDKSQAEIEATSKETLKNEPDPILPSESDSRVTKPVAVPTREVQRDSIQNSIQPKITKPVKAAEKAEKEEDPLSFNFLYYIIEKFKLSDIME
jgi:hypothetical protein